MKYRLHIGPHKHIDIEKIPTSMIWYQAIDVHGVAGVVSGDLLRNVIRGWDVFYSIDSPTPKAVFPRRSRLEKLGDEEE